MKTKDFTYALPEALIAQVPLKDRTQSRLLKVNRSTDIFTDHTFTDLKKFLRPGDVLVLNDSAVIPARLYGIKQKTGAMLEVLLLKPLGLKKYQALVKKARKVDVGTVIIIGEGRLIMTCNRVLDVGIREFDLTYDGDFYTLLEALGEMPLPPYIHEKLEAKDRYQTVYAKEKGSSAAPTAGLHFTLAFLSELQAAGIIITAITLHVGLGTFRPVKVEDVMAHKMHEESYQISAKTAEILNAARAEHRRIVAVGTTVLRTLETEMTKRLHFTATKGVSELFIYPGFEFQVVDALFTNFHLPESTLLMLVSAFATKRLILEAYAHAVREKYRFFSFGDAMFIE